jgi:hypothetical protein
MEQQDKIKEWKEKYTYVYKVTSGGEDFYFRPLTRDDYITLTMRQLTTQGFDHDKEVFKTCVLNEYDEKLLTAKGGIVTVVVEKIMIYSGFENVEVEEV